MLAVQDDWIQYEAVPARRVAVRGGATCAQRIPVVRAATPARAVLRVIDPPVPRPRARRRPLRLTRRGRIVLVVMPGLLAVSGALVLLSGTGPAEASPVRVLPTAPVAAHPAEAPAAAVVRRGDVLRLPGQR